MAKVKGKGTLLQREVATVMTTLAQVISLSGLETDPETFDGRTLDQADEWVPHDATGYADVSELSGELFHDPAIHGAFWDAPTTSYSWQVKFADTGATTVAFAGMIGLGISVDAGDGLKSSFSIQPSAGITVT